METRSEIKTFKVEYKCPKCETGYMLQGGVVWDSFPPSYEHSCDNTECEFSTMLGKRYPYIEYDKIIK